MNDTLITKYFKEAAKGFVFRKTILNAIEFFLKAAVRARTLVPSKVGANTKKIRPRNGIKRVDRLLKNRFFSQEFCRDAYIHFLKKLLPKDKPIVLAIDWTTIKSKYNFFSVSWVHSSGRTIPLFFDGYEITKLDIDKSQTSIEHNALKKILSALTNCPSVTVLADRGFDSPRTINLLCRYKVNFVIRAKIDKYLLLSSGEKILIHHSMVREEGTLKLSDVTYTLATPVVTNFYGIWEKNQSEPWLLLSNLDLKAKEVADLYAKRWQIEEMFKSMKNQVPVTPEGVIRIV